MQSLFPIFGKMHYIIRITSYNVCYTKLLRKDYVVHLAENGKKALHTLEDTNVDLIISDIMMPEMDGVTLCKKVKENISTCHIPIILLTAKSDNVTKLEGFSLGIDDYIEKPFDKELFLARVKALFNNRA